jgi:hypothetical protein
LGLGPEGVGRTSGALVLGPLVADPFDEPDSPGKPRIAQPDNNTAVQASAVTVAKSFIGSSYVGKKYCLSLERTG